MTRPISSFLLFLLLAVPVIAAEPYQVGGWWTCPQGFVIHDGICWGQESLRGPQFEQSNLPSAGDGALGTVCPSGGCGVYGEYNTFRIYVLHDWSR